MNRPILTWIGTAFVAVAALDAAGGRDSCEPQWSDGFGPTGFNGPIYSLVVWDDGTGPALYAGGSFTMAGAVPTNHIAKWDGTAWSPLSGPAGNGMGGGGFPYVYALATYDDGTGSALYAGGVFTMAGGITVNHIAKWDGTDWSPLAGAAGIGMSSAVSALTAYDDGTGPALYAGGSFTTAGGVTANRIAKWDGTDWSPLVGPAGNGMNSSSAVTALTAYDDGTGSALYAGGTFTAAGGVTANRIAKWDGTDWSPLVGPAGNGMNSSVLALTTHDDGTGSALYAGGQFSSAGGVSANRVARWDGTDWSPLVGPAGNGMPGMSSVRALASFDHGAGPALYAGGQFTTAGGRTANYIAKWDGEDWSPLVGPAANGTNGIVHAIATHDDGTGPGLYAGGGFTTAGGVAAAIVGRWDGAAWSPVLGVAGNGMNYLGYVKTLSTYADATGSALYAGGEFTAAGGAMTNRIAQWKAAAWSPLNGPAGDGLDGNVHAAATYNDGTGAVLYAGGSFATAGGVRARYIAKWDGTAWSPLVGPAGIAMNSAVAALTTYDDGTGPALYAGGWFTYADGVAVGRVAKWDGTDWTPLVGPAGVGVGGDGGTVVVYALATYDDGTGAALYAGGEFARAGGVTANRVARWDGTAWSPLVGPGGNGVNNTVRALATYDDGTGPALYAGGFFTAAGGVTANRIAKWDGTAWSSLVGPVGNGLNQPVLALATHNDGMGPALYAGGGFNTAGGVTANSIAKWDGTAWSPLIGPSGINGVPGGGVDTIATHDDGTGPALYAGGTFTAAGGVPSAYIAKWSCTATPCTGDANGDGVVDLTDFEMFAQCFTGVDVPISEECAFSDLDADGDADLHDFAVFQVQFGEACP